MQTKRQVKFCVLLGSSENKDLKFDCKEMTIVLLRCFQACVYKQHVSWWLYNQHFISSASASTGFL